MEDRHKYKAYHIPSKQIISCEGVEELSNEEEFRITEKLELDLIKHVNPWDTIKSWHYRSISILNHPDFTPLQCTGLKDIESNLIYDKYIVEVQEDRWFDGAKFRNGEKIIVDIGNYYLMAILETLQLKILGNKYENPELLESLE